MAKDTAQEKDQSMEEILQSIKRIIAEEGEDAGETMDSDRADDRNIVGSNVLDLEEMSEPSGNSAAVLELTEEVGTVKAAPASVSPAPTAPRPAATAQASPGNTDKRDVLANIDSLLSDETVKASSAALRALSQAQAPAKTARDVTSASPAFRSGITVEDLVMEALKPMLKGWLDQHLPRIVNELVAKEIKKLTN